MVSPSQLAATSLEKSGIVQRSPVPPGCRNTWSAHERGVDRADRKPGAVFFGAKHATMLAANAAVTRVAVSMPAGGAVLNEAAEDIRVNDSPTIKLPQNERQQWVDCGHPGIGATFKNPHRPEIALTPTGSVALWLPTGLADRISLRQRFNETQTRYF